MYKKVEINMWCISNFVKDFGHTDEINIEWKTNKL